MPSPSSRFQDQVVLVTGASSGIGEAVALAFAAEGARVALLARSPERLAAVAAEVGRRGGRALTLVADVTDRTRVSQAVEALVREWGRIDILVNNAGIGAHG